MAEHDRRTVQVGNYEVTVVPQRIAYLQRRLGSLIGTLGDDVKVDTDMDQTIRGLGEKAYDALCLFIPDLAAKMPPWEFAGYPTREVMEADLRGDDVDPGDDQWSPTFPQIKGAFIAAIEVNQLDAFKSLGKLFNKDLLAAGLNARLADYLTANGEPSETSSVTSGPDTPSTT